jgi:hypothetical protein
VAVTSALAAGGTVIDRQPAVDVGEAGDEGPPSVVFEGATAVRGVAALVGEIVVTDGEGGRSALAEPLDEQPVSRVIPAVERAAMAVAVRRVALRRLNAPSLVSAAREGGGVLVRECVRGAGRPVRVGDVPGPSGIRGFGSAREQVSQTLLLAAPAGR